MSKAKPESRPESRRTMPGRNGGTLVIGGRKGGRTPDEFKRTMRAMASAAECEAYLRACLRGEHGPKAFISARTHVVEHGYGKPTQAVDLTSGGEKLARFTLDMGDTPDVD